jgi:alpha-tubulin suppressor-like RCC1 family protein
MKGTINANALLFCILLILTGQAWSNEAPKIFVQSYANHIDAGGHHSMAIDKNGCLWAWGNNGSGRLGNADAGLKASKPVPVNTTNGDGQLSSIISVDGGFSHTIALLENGNVMAWGNNNMKQLGNDSIVQSSFLPIYVNGPDEKPIMSDVIAVAAGKHHSVVLCSDGSVWTWGTNTHGQLGNKTPLNYSQSRPVRVINSDDTGFLSEIVAISSGAYHTLALHKNGTILAWGSNESGQLGLGSDAIHHQNPMPINELTDITHISAGEYHSLARKSNGTVWAWGSNESGQLGYLTNNNSYSTSPHQVLASDGVNNLMNVVGVSAGASHSLALKNDSTIMAWGNNQSGQLGDGSETSTIYPTVVKHTNGSDLLENVVAISAGDLHSLARLKNGQVMAWGGNNEGQLGNNGKKAILPAFVVDDNSENILQLGEQVFFVHATEDQVSNSVSFVLRDTNGQEITLSAISSNESLMHPEKLEFNYTTQPLKISVPSEQSVNVLFSFQTESDQYGSSQVSIVATDSLGASDTVQLNVIVLPINDPPVISSVQNIEIDEDTTSHLIPFSVLDVDGDDLTVSVQSLNTQLIPIDGLILSGSTMHRNIQITPNPNQYGAADIILSVSDPYGLSSQTHFYVNVEPVNDPPHIRIWPGVRQIVCGYYHNIAIQHDWTVWAWGYNGTGQLGDGTDTPHNLPIQVKGPNGVGWLSDIIAVAAGNQHSVALSGDGHVMTWGGNTNGQLGNATFESSYTPVYVLNEFNEPFENVTSIASGTSHVLLLTEQNELWAWGKNENGQLANNTPTSYNRPIRIVGLPSNRIVQIAAGDAHSMVLLDNGEIWSWGDNAFGQLGIGDDVSALIPTQVRQENGEPLTNIISIAAGAFHSLALSNDGYIWAFGHNENGQLGTGSSANLSIPAKVQHPDNGESLDEIVFIAAGSSHSLAIQNNGAIWAWGNNKYGQLGDGTQQNQFLPKRIYDKDIPIDQVITIDAGRQHTVLHTGNVWAWGANYSLQLGTGTSNGSLIPIQTRSSDGNTIFSPGVFPLEYYTVDGIPAQPVLVSLHDVETPSTDLILSATSFDTQILPQNNILIQGTGVNRQIILTPDINQTGKVVVELKVSDNTESYSRQLTLGVNKFSLSPTISDIDDFIANEDQVITNITFVIDDPDTPIEQLTVQVTSSNTELVPNHPETISLSGIDQNKRITIKPLENKSGTTLISIRVSDGINIARSNFTLTIQPINDPPLISEIQDQEILSEEFSKTVGFTISDLETEPQNLSTWAISSNTAIVPNDSHHLIISGDSSNKTLAITPSKEDAGVLTITVFVSDGTETQSTNFELTVQSYKKSPRISEIENQIMQEDSAISVNFVVTDADSDPNELSFSVVSSNTFVIPNDSQNLSISGNGENRIVHIKPKANQAGSVRITIEARDLDDLYDQTSFMVTVENINDPPSISKIDDIEIKENNTTPPIEFTIFDAELPAEALLLTVTSVNELLVPNDRFHLKLDGNDNNRLLTITPLPNTTGETTIRIQLSDGTIPVWESFVLNVEPENFPPVISPIGFQVTEVSTSLDISFTVSDSETPSYLLDLSVQSSDPTIVPNSTENLTLSSGIGDERHLKITPIATESGLLTITLMLQDDLSTTEQSFTLIVNHPPYISSVSDQETDEDTPLSSQITFTINDADTNTDQLILKAFSANQDLIPNDDNHLKFLGNGFFRNLNIVPAANQHGTTHISVTITDGYSESQTGFDITVRPINDAPFIQAMTSIITNEDVAASSVALTIGDLETPADLLSLSISSYNHMLLPLQNIHITTQSAKRYISLTPTANQYGTAIITLKVNDPEGLTAVHELFVQVQSVNDVPVSMDQHYDTRMNVPLTNVLQANDIDGDALTYAISAHPDKGSVMLLNASTGEFTYQPFLDQYGTDVFLFVASDGIATSVEGTVTIRVYDDIPPQITLNGLNPDYIMKGQSFEDFGVKSAYDNADGNLKDQVEIIGLDQINTSVTGTYHITYRVKDKSGNMAQVTREVVVLENSGQLQGTVVNIPDLIDPENDISVQLLDVISNQVLREPYITFDYQRLHFKFVYLPYQTYILRLIVTSSEYLTETKDHIVLFQTNNQDVQLSVPQLTEKNLGYQLTVNIDGDYNVYDTYQYTIIDYLTGNTIYDESSKASQFTKFLKSGSYRLIIIAKGYEPYEYQHGDGNPYIRLDQHDMTIGAILKEDLTFHPETTQIDVSHTLFDTDTDNGFHLWFVRKAYNSDADFRVTIQSKTTEIRLDQWGDGLNLLDNHPYVYTWTVSSAEDSQSPLYHKKESIGQDTQYSVVFHFYKGADLIQSYTVNYISQSPHSIHISKEKEILQDYMNDTVTYETQSETKFYPLAGVDLNLTFKNSMEEIIHKSVFIPPIPLDYFVIPDTQRKLSASEKLIANVTYYTFGGKGPSDVIRIEFETLDGDTVLYNPENMRHASAPKITIPLHLNRHSFYFEGIQQNRLSQAKEMLHVVVNDGADHSGGFHKEEIPFIIQDDGLILCKINHLSTITLEINENWNAFKDKNLNDGRCFVQTLNNSNLLSQLFLWLIIVIGSSGLIIKTKGKQI